MICKEKGVLPGSQYFFFAPSDMFKKYYFCLLNCGKFICDKGYHIKRNGYISPLVIYMTNGTLFLNYEGRNYEANKDEVVLINCYNPHEYWCRTNCEFLYFHFSGSNTYEITDHLIAQNGGAVFKLENKSRVRDPMENVLSRLYKTEYLSDIEMSCAVYSTVSSIQSMNEDLPTASALANSLGRAISFIKSNIDKPLTLDILSKQANLSKYYFLHLFKKETGLTPMEYISHLRINLAKNILKTTTRTMSDIADTLGYSSNSSFINAFTLKTGITPNKYRHAPLHMAGDKENITL